MNSGASPTRANRLRPRHKSPPDHGRQAVISLFVLGILAIAGQMMAAIPAHAIPQVRVVYLIPADRHPHDAYAARLDQLLRMTQQYFARQMASAGYVTPTGKGKTFVYEADADGRLIVHLIDHRPGQPHADADKHTAYYTKNPYSINEEIPVLLGAEFTRDALVVRITEFSFVNPDHGLANAPNCGGGATLWEGDHIFGNDLDHPGVTPAPLKFNTLGHNDAEQQEIFRDHRYTNIWGGGPCWRPEVPDWHADEWHDLQNSQVWEYATVFIGAFIHEMGHALNLSHCFISTQSPVDPTVFGDFQLMGNGFRGIFASLYPNAGFSGHGQYPRHPVDQRPKVCGSPVVIDASQLAVLNGNPFFNPETTTTDRDAPVVTELSVTQADGNERVGVGASGLQVRCVARDREGPNASGLSHVAFLLDGNNRGLVMAPRNAGPEAGINTIKLLDARRGEDPNMLLPRGLHWLYAQAMDRAGNLVGTDNPQANVPFSVGEDRISDWLVWDRFFTAAGDAPDKLLQRSWLPVTDADLRPEPDQQLGRGRWRRVHSGSYLDCHGLSSKYFASITDTWARMAYAAARIQSKRDRDVTVHVGNDDFSQAWLNGELLYTEDATKSGHGAFDVPKYNHATMRLRAGLNCLVVKVLDTGGGCGVHVWFTEKHDTPVFFGPATRDAEVVIRE